MLRMILASVVVALIGLNISVSLAETPDYNVCGDSTSYVCFLGTEPVNYWPEKEVVTDSGPCGIAGCDCGCRETGVCTCKTSKVTTKETPKYRPPVYRTYTTATTASRRAPAGWSCGPNGCYQIQTTYDYDPGPVQAPPSTLTYSQPGTYTYQTTSGCSGGYSGGDRSYGSIARRGPIRGVLSRLFSRCR